MNGFPRSFCSSVASNAMSAANSSGQLLLLMNLSFDMWMSVQVMPETIHPVDINAADLRLVIELRVYVLMPGGRCVGINYS